MQDTASGYSLKNYTFVFKHKAGVKNKVVDMLSRRVMILVAMSTKVTGFERLREKYESCTDFGEIYRSCYKTDLFER